MFPLSSKGRLIRLNKDGTNGEIIQSNKTKMVFGTSIFDDHHIKDVNPANQVSCEISTDDSGRVSIANKTTNEIFVNDKAIIRPSVRPLFNNSIIKICDGVEFRWVFVKQAKENIGGDLNDADFASWSDPAKKHMKLIRVQRSKGRLTAHPLNLYSSAHEDVDDKDVPSAESDDERSTGCSVIPTQLNDSVFIEQGPNVTAPLIDVSQALINLDETQMAATEQITSTANATLVKNEMESDGDLMNFDVPSEQSTECNAVAIKSQPSNCSVITLSSDGSQGTGTQETNDKNVDFDDEEMFERSISCPPIELPDDLFETSANEDTENLASANSTEGADTTDKANVKCEQLDVKGKEDEEKQKVVSHRSLLDIDSTQNLTNADTSIEQFSSNDDDDVIPETQDIFVPETQEVLSQDSDVQVLSESCSIIDCDKSEYSFKSEATISKIVKQNISIGQPNMSVVSLSSEEGDEESQVEAANEHSTVLDSENMFEADASDEHQQNVELKAEVPSSPSPSQQQQQQQQQQDDVLEKSTQNEQTSTFNESVTMFSQSLSVDANESITDTKPQLLDEPTSEIASPESSTSTLQESEKSGEVQAMKQETITDTTTNDLQNTTVEPIQSELQTVELQKNDSILAPADDSASKVQSEEGLMATEATTTAQREAVEIGNDTISKSFLSESCTTQNETEQFDSNTENEANVPVDESISHLQTTDLVNAPETEVEENVSEPIESNIDEAECVVPIATSSSVSVCLSTDTTQELNLLAFSSELDAQGEDQMDDDTMDRLEFSSSDSMFESIDSGNITASCDNTSSVNVTSEANQSVSPSMKSTGDTTIMAEIEVAQTPSKVNASVADSTTDSPTADLSKVDDIPSNEFETTSMVSEDSSSVGQVEKIVDDSMSKEEEGEVNESVDEVIMPTQNHEEVAVIATPVKAQSTIECDSSVTRSTRRRQPNLEITNISTPRKLNISVAQNTPSKIQTPSLSKVMQNESAILAKDEDQENAESKSLVAQSNVDQSEKVEVESPQNADDVVAFSTPAKIIVKSDENHGSSVTRTSRRKQPFSIDAATPKRTPRKLNVSFAATTPCKVEPQSSAESKQNESVLEVKQVEENVESVENVEPMQTDEDTDSTPSEVVTVNAEAIDDQTTLSTPVQNAIKSDESRALTLPRATRRKPLIAELSSVTPKRSMPRKLNVSMALTTETPSSAIQKPIETQEEESEVKSELTSTKDEQVESVESAQREEAVFATPVKVPPVAKSNSTITRSTRRNKESVSTETTMPKRTPRKLNVSHIPETLSEPETQLSAESVTEQQQVEGYVESAEYVDELFNLLLQSGEDAISTPADEVAVNAEAIDEQIEKNEPEASENINDTTIDIKDIFSTPVQNAIKSDESRALTLPRSTRRKPLIAELSSVTPKRTPRKLNVSLALTTETTSSAIQKPIETQEEESDEKSEVIAINDQVCIESAQNEDAVQSTLDESIAPEQSPEGNVESEPMEKEPMENEPIASINDDNVDEVVELISTNEATPSEETNVQDELQQTQNDIVIATPVKMESINEIYDKATSSVTRSTLRKQNPVVEFATPKQTPRKLNMTLVSETPCESESAEEGQSHENLESQVPSNSEAQDNVFESTLSRVFATPAKIEPNRECSSAMTRSTRRKQPILEIASTTPKRTPRKLNVIHIHETPSDPEMQSSTGSNQNENITEEKQVEDNVELVESIEKEEPTQIDEGIVLPPSEDVTVNAEAIDDLSEKNDTETPESMDEKTTLSTPVQNAVKSDESRALTLPRATRRKPLIAELSSFTPKRTPRKLNQTLSVATKCKSETQTSTESNQNERDTEEKQVDEKVESVQSVEKEEPTQTDEDTVSTPSVDVDENAEAIDDQNENQNDTETPESMDEKTAFSTPVQNTVKSDESRALTLPRTTRRKPLIAELSSVTPKRSTPRKLNVSMALTTETPSSAIQKPIETQEEESEVKSELTSTNDEQVESVSAEPAQHEEVVFATPAKAPLAAQGNSTISRSTRRKQEIVDTMTTKRTPRNLDISYVPETPCEADESSVYELNRSAIVKDGHAEENVDLILVESESNEVVQSHDDTAVSSTPVKIDSVTNLGANSALTRSTRRNTVVESATPKQTPRKLAMATLCKIDTSEDAPAEENVQLDPTENEPISNFEDKNVDEVVEPSPTKGATSSEEANVQVEISQMENDIVVATPIKKGTNNMFDDKATSSVTRSTRRKQNTFVETPKQILRKLNVTLASETPCNTEIVSSLEEPLSEDEPTESAAVNENQVQEASEVTSTESEQTENVMIGHSTQSEDIAGVTTPAKPETVIKLAGDSNSAVIQSSKRKRPDLETETPVGKRTKRRKTPPVETQPPVEPEEEEVLNFIEKAEENVAEPVSENINSVDNREIEDKPTDEIYECIEAELAVIHDDVVPEKISKATRATRSSKASRTTKRKPNADREAAVQTPKDFNCVVKMTPLKSETLRTFRQENVASVQSDVEKPNPTESKVNFDVAIPSTSQTPSTPLKKRSTRLRTTSKSESTIEQSRSKDAVNVLVAAVLEENLIDNAAASSSEVAGKRAGTPLPASKKRAGRLTGQKTKLSLELSDKQNLIDSEKQDAVDASKQSEDTALENKSESAENGVVAKRKTLRRKKLEDVVQTSKEKKAAGSSGTPLNKRNRNLVVEPSDETAPSTSEPAEMADDDELKNSKEKSEKTAAKMTRRKRANTEIDPDENTPKKLKTQLNHVNSAAVGTPHSLRSLRNRVLTIVEPSSTATPKTTRNTRKAKNDDNKDEEVESVVPKDKEEEADKPVPTETEKPKRQPRRKLTRKASVDEPPKGSIIQTNDEKKDSVTEAIKETEEPIEGNKPKPATKRSRAKSKGPAEEAKSNDDDASAKPPAKRGRKASQAQGKPTVIVEPVIVIEPVVVVEPVVDLTEEESVEQPVEKKPRRGRPKKVVIVESTETETTEAPKPAPKKRAERGRTVSKSEENIAMASSEEPAKQETVEEEKVSTKEPPKARGKRTRKADTEVVVVEAEKEKEQPKRSRNTKKAKDLEPEPEVESSAKETVAEKKPRKTKKAAESNDTEASTSTPRISTRTRRHK
ncbi:mucin-2-like [Sitodiplosis mosellana]|uniref:mucin-2-like n=1 Tax=Sitodiplosis mosellana TaxID=263140 RepID=UPI0024448B74|nr:mucin-2-like [Sitodiplosis mosellana]